MQASEYFELAGQVNDLVKYMDKPLIDLYNLGCSNHVSLQDVDLSGLRPGRVFKSTSKGFCGHQEERKVLTLTSCLPDSLSHLKLAAESVKEFNCALVKLYNLTEDKVSVTLHLDRSDVEKGLSLTAQLQAAIF